MKRSLGRAVAPLALALVAMNGAGAQEGATGNRMAGVVTGPDDKPVAGAQVRVAAPEGERLGPLATRTDERGRWTVQGLAPGRWEIVIEAPGFYTTEGTVDVPAAGPAPAVEVELRSLDEETPGFYEGSPSTLRGWLERGNNLLAQGRSTEARVEYEKALRILPAAERPPILQAIARTHFLEGETDQALEALTMALRIEPDSEELRRLFAALLVTDDRAGETDRLLAEIEAAGPPANEAAAPSTPRPQRQPSPLLEPQPGRAGSYRTAFAERSPLSGIDVYLERYGYSRDDIGGVDPAVGEYEISAESFEVVVPATENGEPAEGGPLGLFVWISPTPWGGFSREDTAEVLARHRLIWVGANRSGNERAAWYRVAFALDAVHNMSALYDIDPRRIWIGGYSGGGRLASSMAILYPEVFRGGLFAYGCDYFRRLAVPYKPGAWWPPKFPEPDRGRLREVKAESRLVFLTGNRDFNRAQTKATWRQAREDGFRNAVYLEIPGANHYAGINGTWLERAFTALEPTSELQAAE
jgi:tetratricopeptide (TPR) repeat protein